MTTQIATELRGSKVLSGTARAPETQTHKEFSAGDDLSPEEQAVSGIEVDPDVEARLEPPSDEGDTAALAEGLDQPPKSHRDEPV